MTQALQSSSVPQFEIASLYPRMLAYLVDWQIRVMLSFLVFTFFTLADYGTLPSLSGSLSIKASLLALCVYFLYYVVVETMMGGKTPGKCCLGLQVRCSNGQMANRRQLIFRNMFRFIDGFPGNYAVGLLITVLHDNPLRLGDIATQTAVFHISDRLVCDTPTSRAQAIQ